ncbi:MAG: hypothetical protein OXL40_03805 [Bacteroidota bacterium]|nr:hypothetical protein [Bacteroidota bacterium]
MKPLLELKWRKEIHRTKLDYAFGTRSLDFIQIKRKTRVHGLACGLNHQYHTLLPASAILAERQTSAPVVACGEAVMTIMG